MSRPDLNLLLALDALLDEGSESHRVLRRLHFLRECSHEQDQQVFP